MKGTSDLVALMGAIRDAGLTELVAGTYPYETATRIIETGSDLQGREPGHFAEDTALTASVLANPVNWGIGDPAWTDFCINWSEA